MKEVLDKINGIVWGIPTLLLILVAGLYLTIRSGFFQVVFLPRAFRSFLGKLKPSAKTENGVSPYQALCTALAATVGTGNIAGVAGAIALGGPGAVFWMWVCAFLGMILKCAEATLAVKYRRVNGQGEVIGGPMHMIEQGLGRRFRWLAVLYAFFGVVAAFGVGNATQINAVLGGIHSAANYFGVAVPFKADLVIAAILAVMIAFMLSGGGKRIGRIAEAVVPIASVFYILLGLGVLIVRADMLPAAFHTILQGAFAPEAVTGGVVGSMFFVCRVGSARGIFTNEAGMGTASIAHAAAEVSHPVEQGLMGIMEVFLDTIVICTITALVILCSSVPIPYGQDPGSMLTTSAFSQIYGGWVSILIALSLVCFAVATVLGWSYYGLRCAQYLFGDGIFKLFVVTQIITVILGAVLKTGTVWVMAEIVNGLMAVPNLIALMGLSPRFLKLLQEYKIGKLFAYGGTNENFNQCKSLRTFSYAEIPSYGGSSAKRGEDHISSEYRSA